MKTDVSDCISRFHQTNSGSTCLLCDITNASYTPYDTKPSVLLFHETTRQRMLGGSKGKVGGSKKEVAGRSKKKVPGGQKKGGVRIECWGVKKIGGPKSTLEVKESFWDDITKLPP